MSDKPTISVIVPVYNAERFLPMCLDSILSQDYTHWEAILVDDGSTDLGGKICDRYAKIDPRIKVVHQENLGSSLARETGLQMAEGKFICFLDADDWIDVNHLSQLSAVAGNQDADVVLSAFVMESESRQKLCSNEPSGFDWETVIRNNLDGTRHAGLWCTFARHELYTKNCIRFPGDAFFEDMYMCCSLVYYADKIAYSSTASYHYRIHETSMTQEPDVRKQIHRYYEFSRNMKALFDDLNLWGNPKLTESLNKRVVFQKKHLFKYPGDQYIDEVLKQSFPESYKYVEVRSLPDFLLYLSFRIRRVWPFRLMKRIQAIKIRINSVRHAT